MKPFILILGLHFIICNTEAQTPSGRGEFATNTNGLMYNNTDMNELRFIVDSLNLQFKSCNLSRVYYAKTQAPLTIAVFKSEADDLKSIMKDIVRNPDFSALTEKYKHLLINIDSTKLVVESYYDNKDGMEKYLIGDPLNGYDIDEAYSAAHKENPGENARWLYSYEKKNEYNKANYLTCYYRAELFSSTKIPTEYAKLIQYVDCMIDTTSSVFLIKEKTDDEWDNDEEGKYNNIYALSKFIDKARKKPVKYNKDGYLTSEQYDFALDSLLENNAFKKILSATLDDYIENWGHNDQLEFLAEKAGFYDKALLLKRNHRVMGYCSMDQRPRMQARDIAILSAKTHKWDIFLRAHLDIMNDRFERMSDGSYAYEGRKTYLKELEELNLNIVDLMIGLTLRAQHMPKNHYYGTIWRLGRALTESREKEKFESVVLKMVKDEQLDKFNRGLLFLLYNSYLRHLETAEATQKISSLKKNINDFPLFIQQSVAKLKFPNTKN